MNAVASGLNLKPGDEILTSDHEHAGGIVCRQYSAERTDAKIVQVEMPVPATSPEQILSRVADGLSDRTRVCSLCHVDTLTGVRMPLTAIAELIRPS